MPPKKHYIRIRVPSWMAGHRGKAFWIRFGLLGLGAGLAMLVGVWYHEISHISYALLASKGLDIAGEALAESIAEDV